MWRRKGLPGCWDAGSASGVHLELWLLLVSRILMQLACLHFFGDTLAICALKLERRQGSFCWNLGSSQRLTCWGFVDVKFEFQRVVLFLDRSQEPGGRMGE